MLIEEGLRERRSIIRKVRRSAAKSEAAIAS
jgi:hypothetical protein